MPESPPAQAPYARPSLLDIEARIAQQQLPPVAQWRPARVAEVDIVIHRDGSWSYQGSPIQRKRMISLFSRILRLEKEGRYCLVTPEEKLYITVEDAPFTAVSLDIYNEQDRDRTLVFATNVGEHVILDQQHPLWLEHDERDNPRPYLLVRDGLRALLSRSVYYQLAEACTTRDGHFGIFSRGFFHILESSTDHEQS